jgi:hypothetical protein
MGGFKSPVQRPQIDDVINNVTIWEQGEHGGADVTHSHLTSDAKRHYVVS